MECKEKCSIVEDLIPSYIDELTNDTTNKMIVKHMNECDSCKEKYQKQLVRNQLQKQTEEKMDDSFGHRLAKYRYQLMGLLIGIAVTISAIVGIGVGASLYFTIKNSIRNYTEDISEYGEFKNYYGLSELSLFPPADKTGSNETEIIKYTYDCYGSKLYQSCQIYLECRYSENEYQTEKERLMTITNSETGKSAIYDETAFYYPAVYAMLNYEGCFEYALFFEEEQKIIYVFVQGGIDRRDLLFSEEYLPVKYGQNGIFCDLQEYRIYPLSDIFTQNY